MTTSNKKLAEALRQILIKEFEILQKKNPRFSLRAFARKGKVNHVYIFRVINGTRGITYKSFLELAATLGIPSSRFKRIVEEFNEAEGQDALHQINSVEQYRANGSLRANVIAGIISQLRPKMDFKHIAKISGFSVEEVKKTIQSAIELGLVKINPDGTLDWIKGTFLQPLNNSESVVEIKNQNLLGALQSAKDYYKENCLSQIQSPKKAYFATCSFSNTEIQFNRKLSAQLLQEQIRLTKTLKDIKLKLKKGKVPQKYATYQWTLSIVPTWVEK